MKRIAATGAIALGLLVSASPLLADEYIAAYTCKMNEGKKVEDVQAANSAWLKWVRENVHKDISSNVGTAVVGDFDTFLFVDSYPDLATWAAAVTALEGAPDSIEEGLDAAAKCERNRLWRMRPTP
jgi:hypothetical protein